MRARPWPAVTMPTQPVAARANDAEPAAGVGCRGRMRPAPWRRGVPGTPTRRLLLEATKKIVSSSLELLGVPNVLVGLLFVVGQPLADPDQQG